MMRKTITRSLVTSTIKAFTVDFTDGNPVAKALDPVTIVGKAKEKDAIKAVRNAYNITAFTIGEIVYSESVYEISVEDFMKYATKID